MERTLPVILRSIIKIVVYREKTNRNIPKAITNNIKYPLFDWQRQALENLLIFNNKKTEQTSKQATHLLFNMATGAGKTLLMASCILYYYQKGYRPRQIFI